MLHINLKPANRRAVVKVSIKIVYEALKKFKLTKNLYSKKDIAL
jgi:hypothetical protein